MAAGTNENIIPGDVAEQLIRAHDGDCALLYIWQLQRKTYSPEQAARDLCKTLREIESAEEKLDRMGLLSTYGKAVPKSVSPETPSVPRPADEYPEYTADDIAQAKSADPAFSDLQSRLTDVMGKIPTRHDLSRLLGIYNHLGLSPEVICVLFSYCAEISSGPTGTERKPTMSFIERTAYEWKNHGIEDVEEAETYAEKLQALRSASGRIKTVIEIYDRKLTSNETKFIESWLSMGFEDEAIRTAYERTVEKTGQRSLPYMDKILKTWNEAGIHTVREIDEKDGARKKTASGRGRRPAVQEPFNPDAIKEVTITKGR